MGGLTWFHLWPSVWYFLPHWWKSKWWFGFPKMLWWSVKTTFIGIPLAILEPTEKSCHLEEQGKMWVGHHGLQHWASGEPARFCQGEFLVRQTTQWGMLVDSHYTWLAANSTHKSSRNAPENLSSITTVSRLFLTKAAMTYRSGEHWFQCVKKIIHALSYNDLQSCSNLVEQWQFPRGKQFWFQN